MPKVSVIIPTANRSALLGRAISSVLNQTYVELECIVVDDASVDDTPNVVDGIQDDRLIYIRHEVSKHASATRNTGINAARGKYIAFLDDDDEWLESKLHKQVELMESKPDNIGLVYCWLDYCLEGEIISSRKPVLEGDIFKETLSKQPIGNSSTLLIRSDIISNVGGFDESLPRGNDGDFIRRVCQKYHVAVVKETLVKMYVEHGYQRITSDDVVGVENALNSLYDRVKKFSSEINRYPKEFSEIYGSIAIQHAKLGQAFLAIKNLFRAYKTHVFSKTNIISSLKVIKQFFLRR